eukprot:403367956
MNEIKQQQDQILSKENKMLRFKITDFTAQPQIQNVLIKIWKLMIQLQYDDSHLQQASVKFQNNILAQQEFQKKLIEYSLIPLDIKLYEQTFLIFIKTLGILYDTDYYTAKKPDYLKNVVFFDRFCFDMISLLGDNLVNLDFSDVEYIFRKVYQHTTHFVVKNEYQLHFEQMKVDPSQLQIIDKEKRKYESIMQKMGLGSDSRNEQDELSKVVTDDGKEGQSQSFNNNEDAQMGLQGGSLLDLSKMLSQKKKLQEEKQQKLIIIKEKERNARIYNPILIKDNILNKAKDILVYKSKLSKERYFQNDQISTSLNQKTKKNKIDNSQQASMMLFTFDSNQRQGELNNSIDGSQRTLLQQNQDKKLDRIDMKTIELKKMESMEDFSNLNLILEKIMDHRANEDIMKYRTHLMQIKLILSYLSKLVLYLLILTTHNLKEIKGHQILLKLENNLQILFNPKMLQITPLKNPKTNHLSYILASKQTIKIIL